MLVTLATEVAVVLVAEEMMAVLEAQEDQETVAVLEEGQDQVLPNLVSQQTALGQDRHQEAQVNLFIRLELLLVETILHQEVTEKPLSCLI